jgi:tetratricopeptide (TPR) repeat protein
MMKKLFLLILLCSSRFFAQSADITPALQKIESGNNKGAEVILKELKTANPADPSVIYLDGLLTKDGGDALAKYSIVADKYPSSGYADAALYKIYSYYYALGSYNKASVYMERLKRDYPASPCIKSASEPFPDSEETSSVKPADVKTTTAAEAIKKEVKYNFTIQAGAFLNPDNAKKLAERLKKENRPVEISAKEIGGSVLNVVSVGQYVTEEDARRDLSALEKGFNIKGRIVPLVKN